MRILVTGFEPFGSHESNPSQLVVESLGMLPFSGVELATAVLPVTYSGVDALLPSLFLRVQPDAYLALGLAGRNQYLALERAALNLDDTESPDNAGEVRQGVSIDPDGPAAYFSTLPLEKMKVAISTKGYPVRISNHAGAYLCNHAFFLGRHLLAREGQNIPAGFIHLPPLGTPWPMDESRPWTLNDLVDAVRTAIEVVAA